MAKTLEQYIAGLQELIKEYPEAKDFQVVSSADDEGNHFTPVHYDPGLGRFEDGEYQSIGQADEGNDDTKPNAVCIN